MFPNTFSEIYKDKRVSFVDSRRYQRHQKWTQAKDSPTIPIPSAAESINRIKTNITTALREEEMWEPTEAAAFTLIELSHTTTSEAWDTSVYQGGKQLSQREVETSQQHLSVRIHVERVIGLLKNQYSWGNYLFNSWNIVTIVMLLT